MASTCKSNLIVFLATVLIFTNATFPLRLKNILLKYPKKECHGRGGADLLTRSRADHCCGNHCCRYLIPLLELSYCRRRRRHRMSQSSMLLAARRDRYDSRLRDRAVTWWSRDLLTAGVTLAHIMWVLCCLPICREPRGRSARMTVAIGHRRAALWELLLPRTPSHDRVMDMTPGVASGDLWRYSPRAGACSSAN